MRFAIMPAIMLATAVGACGNTSNQLLGLPPSLQQSSLVAESDLQDQMVAKLIGKAGRTAPELRANPALWREVADAGVLEVDIQCDRYLAALFSFHREQRAGRQILTAAGAGTAAILGITGAAGTTVALVAAAFGIAASVFDAGTNSVLFTVSPAAVRAVAARGRQAYLAGILWEKVDSRPRMMMVVQGYLVQCSPAAIESNIDNAATGAPSVSSSNLDTALKAAALAAPSSSVVQNSSVFTASPTGGPRATPATIDPDNRARNVTAAEAPFIRTKEEAQDLQRALGTTADGDLGPADRKPLVGTRLAISEYNAGLLRLDRKAGDGNDVVSPGTYRVLTAEGAMPMQLRSAFERAFFGVRPDCFTIGRAMSAVKGQAIPDTMNDPDRCMKLMREAIKARRAQPGMPAALGDLEALDSKLYDEGRPRPIPAPPPVAITNP